MDSSRRSSLFFSNAQLLFCALSCFIWGVVSQDCPEIPADVATVQNQLDGLKAGVKVNRNISFVWIVWNHEEILISVQRTSSKLISMFVWLFILAFQYYLSSTSSSFQLFCFRSSIIYIDIFSILLIYLGCQDRCSHRGRGGIHSVDRCSRIIGKSLEEIEGSTQQDGNQLGL